MSKKIICLFDVDGTLTIPQQAIDSTLDQYIQETLKKQVDVAVVGGSDIGKIKRQLGGEDIFKKYDYVFAENGLVAYKDSNKLASESIESVIGEKELRDFKTFVGDYIKQLTLPFKYDDYLEHRTGMMNIAPVGRSCTVEERNQFYAYDLENRLRERFIQELKKKFPDLPLTYSIGGQISFDVFPTGWDKTYCLRYLQGYNEIHFFGDKTKEGGNDYEIYESETTVGHRVTGPDDTLKQLKVLVSLIDEKRNKE